MLVCDVHLGSTQTWRRAAPHLTSADDLRPGCLRRLCCHRRRYDSVYAPGKPHCFQSLCCLCYCCCFAVRVSEYVVFDTCQGIPRYLIEFESANATAPTQQ